MINTICRKIKGSLKTPCLCMGIAALFLFVFVSFVPVLTFNSYAGNSDSCLVNDKSEENSLFCPVIKNSYPESPAFVLINNSSLIASTPPNTFSSQVLGALVTGYEQEDVKKVITEYIVEKGDTLSSLAEKFGISINTILWANDLTKNSVVKPGQKLVILPVSGTLHHVKSGDVISSIAQTYKAKTEEIIAFNELKNENAVYIGDIIIIPNGIMPSVAVQKQQTSSNIPVTNSQFIVPVSSPYIITQGLHWYNAIDFSHKDGYACGRPVMAAAGGVIQKTGYDRTAGNYIRILHSNGVVTFYGHLSAITVQKDETVSVGQRIGYIGNTGYTIGSTGCHLHFEVRGAVNPFAK